MEFHKALRIALTCGLPVHRKAWRRWQHIRLLRPTHHPQAIPYLEIITDEGRAPYTPSQYDMMAKDWELFVEVIK